MKRISLLGATGSIGQSTFKVVDSFPDQFKIVFLAAGCSWQAMADLARTYLPKAVALTDETHSDSLREAIKDLPILVYSGEAGLLQGIQDIEADITISAIVGAAGLRPTMKAIEAGSDIALANKESMVVAGSFMNDAAQKYGVSILPVDSEHNAIHQCLRGGLKKEVRRIILTASGGPFRVFTGDMASITPEQALKHPTWKMGPKISIDSATMMNKGLEVIEAFHLFHCSKDEIEIVVHPQSVVHSMVEYTDGSILAQLGKTDMCHPVQYALTYPDRWESPFEFLDFSKGFALGFEPVNHQRFPCINLAYEALEKPDSLPCVLNAANEIAVSAFLNGKIKFTDIPLIASDCMNFFKEFDVQGFEELLQLDLDVRCHAESVIDQIHALSSSSE